MHTEKVCTRRYAHEQRSALDLDDHGAVLLVDVAEALALLAVLEQAGGGQDKQAANAAHAEDGG